MMQDHFTGSGLDASRWLFCNMTTPCTEIPHRVGDSRLALPEHDMWNEGNCLLSRRFLLDQSAVSGEFTGWDEECSGAALGFYAGNGSFWGYVMLAATDTHIQLRVHSGSQNGESFQSGGQPKWLVVSEASWEKHIPFRLTLRRDGQRYAAELDGRLLLEAEIPEIKGDARAMFKALPWRDRLTPTYAYLDWAQVEGFAPTARVQGTVTDGSSVNPIPGAGVHIAGFDEFFTRCDGEGRFVLENVPRGLRTLVAAAEGYAFARLELDCIPGGANCARLDLAAETAEALPRREYNNPSFDRSGQGFLQLNGTWEFSFDPGDQGVQEHWYEPGSPAFDRHIRVPFSWSSLMGFGEEHLVCGDTLHQSNTLFNNYRLVGEWAWYRRSFTVPADFPQGENTVLHIGACANVTYVYLDGRYQGMRVDEFSDLVFDLGPLEPGSVHTLAVRVRYPHDINSHNMGKQIFWFASAPGIWQSVWLEHRRNSHLTWLRLTPDLDFDGEACVRAAVKVSVAAENAAEGTVSLSLTAPESGRVYQADIPLSNGQGEAEIPIPDPELWQYREGRLYAAEAVLNTAEGEQDRVKSYVGLRKAETRWLPGHSPEDTSDPQEQYQYFYLNNKPFYILGILDQCYNAFGIYTYRSLYGEGPEGERGSIAYDIDRTMAYGYNVSRVHIKENEPLWYHECDLRGLPVWTEHPSNFYATPDDPNWQAAYNRELDGMLERLNNHPSIVIVSSINESWGVTGGHTMTPWEHELRSRFLEDSALRAKAGWPHVVVCDNSGFGKTAACELNDFHIYPGDHWEAKARWEELVRSCYPGSTYNYIHHSRGEHAIGEAVQTGRPVVVSEFLHINGIDMQLRMFEKVAGYVRMNVASHETEDSGPLTAERFERDYGYVDHNLEPLDYGMVNNMDMVVPDQNRIVNLQAGEELSVDLYTSHFSWKTVKSPVLHATLTGIDALGRLHTGLQTWETPIAFRQFQVEKQEPLAIKAHKGMRGAYLFTWVSDGEEILCRNYFQLCIHGVETAQEAVAVIHPGSYQSARGDYVWTFQEAGACAVAVKGEGGLTYAFRTGEELSGGSLLLEAGAREGKNAVKVTDECLFPTQISILLDGAEIAQIHPEDDPSDERALFSNAAQGGEPYHYRRTGRLGYGQRFQVKLPCTLEAGDHTLELRCSSGGMTLYGDYTGRFGFAPTIIK